MTTPTLNSVYPRPVDDLLPAARDLVERTGELPSRNRLMKEFKVGAPKATALLEALQQSTPATTPPAGNPAETPPADTSHPRPDSPADPDPAPVPAPVPPVVDAPPAGPVADVSPLPIPPGHPGTNITTTPRKPARPAVVWPVVLLALPAFVAIWSGWVGLGGLTGFGVVHPLPGIADGFSINTAITLPIGVETYGAYALYVWLSGRVPDRARAFAKWSAIASLLVGALGQVAYHLLVAPPTGAPWWITTAVSVLPVAVLGMGAALAHLVRSHD